MRTSALVVALGLVSAPLTGAPIVYDATIVQAESSITLELSLVFGDLEAIDIGTSSITGSSSIVVDNGIPEIRLTSLNAVLADPIDLGLNFYDPDNDDAWVLGIYLQSSAGSLALNMLAPGPAAPIAGDGTFVQTGNSLGIVGTAYLDLLAADPSTEAFLRDLLGGALGVTIPSTIDLSALGGLSFDADLAGVIEQGFDGLRITIPLSITGSTELIAGSAYLHYSVTGQIVMVPEPMSLLLFGVGAVLVAGRRRNG